MQAETRAEIPLVDDTEFFKKYESTAAVAAPKTTPESSAVRPVLATPDEKTTTQKSEELHNFYDSLMKRQSAEDLLNRHTNRVGDSRQENGRKLLETIKKDNRIPAPDFSADGSEASNRKPLDVSRSSRDSILPEEKKSEPVPKDKS